MLFTFSIFSLRCLSCHTHYTMKQNACLAGAFCKAEKPCRARLFAVILSYLLYQTNTIGVRRYPRCSGKVLTFFPLSAETGEEVLPEASARPQGYNREYFRYIG